MSTKRIIAHEVIRLLSGGDPSNNSQLDDRDVMLKVSHVLNTRIKANFYENYKVEGTTAVDGQYVFAISNVQVTHDAARDEYYSTLPDIYVSLPKGRGIRQVSSMKDQCIVFIIRETGTKGIYNSLQAGGLEGNIGVYPEGNKIFYDKKIKKIGITSVLVKIVGSPDSITADSILPMDGSEITSIIQDVMKFYQPVPQDKINNQNPNS